MGKKFTDSKGFNIVLAVLIALTLWLYVNTVENPSQSVTLTNIPITIQNENILNDNGLMVDPTSDFTIDLKLYGTANSLVKIQSNRDSIVVYADVASIQSAGTYTITCNVQSLPSTITSGSVQVQDRDKYTVQLTVKKMAVKTVNVQGSFATGKVPEGYRTGNFTITPSTIEVRGPEDVVNKIDYAQVTINRPELSETYMGDLPFQLIDTDGKVLTDASLTSSADTVNVVLPVLMTADLKLDVEFKDGGGATKKNVEYTVTPSSISISGSEEDVRAFQDKSLIVGSIDLAKVTDDSGTYYFDIVLDSKLANDSGVKSATVEVKVNDLATKTMETSNIEVINAPAGLTVDVVTQSLQVQIRGPAEALDSVSGYQLRAVADLSGQNLPRGKFNWKVTIYLDGTTEVGYIGKDYTIVLSVS